MLALLAPRVKETSTTTGTVTLNLDGAVSGFQTFVAGFGTGGTCYYTIVHGTAWEVGIGTVTDAATDTLSRDTVLASSAAGAKLNLGAGTKTVFCDVTRESITVPQGHLFGLKLANNGADAVNDLDCATGQCASDDSNPDNVMLLQPAAMTKRLDAVWAAGTGNGGRLSSDGLADGTWHCFAFKPSAGADDFFFSTSVNPTPPSGTKKRRIGSILRESATIVPFIQWNERFDRMVPILNLSSAATGSQTVTLSVPTGITVIAVINSACNESTTSGLVLSAPDITDVNASLTVAPLCMNGTNSSDLSAVGPQFIRTNTSAQIHWHARTGGSGNTYIATLGWLDDRGKSS